MLSDILSNTFNRQNQAIKDAGLEQDSTMDHHFLGCSPENEPNEQEIEEEAQWGTKQGIAEEHSVGQHHGLDVRQI
jgi:hypothetical protein